jgi:hypothetical protein
MARKEKPVERDIAEILNNPVDKSTLRGFLSEAVLVRQKLADEQESFRVLRSEAFEKLGLSPKLFNSLVRISYDNNHLEKLSEIHALDDAIEMLFATAE